ncbi:MAG: SPOR domain-containing protein [Bacteroidales bacterium]|jgi:cell division protein FtsN|nr:SPOR domain-containing protein [Bacteroidales bacterium]
MRYIVKVLVAVWFPAVCFAQSAKLPLYFDNSDYQYAVKRAMTLLMQSDSLQRMVEIYTDSLPTAPNDNKQLLKMMIRDDHTLSVTLRKEADEWFVRANKFIAEHQKTVSYKPVETVAEEDIHPENLPEKAPTTTAKPPSEFKILAASPYSAKNPVPTDQPLPDGVVYKIQLGAFSKPVAANTFKGLSPVSGEKLPSGVVKYYVGLFRTNAEAEKALREVKQYGYKDSFVVAFYNKKSIILTRAVQLEKIVNQ